MNPTQKWAAITHLTMHDAVPSGSVAMCSRLARPNLPSHKGLPTIWRCNYT